MGERPIIKVNHCCAPESAATAITQRSRLGSVVSYSNSKFLELPSESSVSDVAEDPARYRTQQCNKRKYSIPTHLGANLDTASSLARRRLSNVSDVVTRKLSNTIGWRLSHMPSQDIVEIGRSLCSQYIRSRLRRAGYLSKKCGLQRLRSAMNLPSAGTVFREVYPELLGLGLELERNHPKLYVNVTRQASSLPGGRFNNDKEPGAVFTAISRELLKQDISWVKIVSLYAVAGGLAVDCVRQGHYDYLPSIMEAMEEVLEDDLAHWIQEKGGWSALSVLVRPPTGVWPSLRIYAYAASITTVTILVVVIFRLIGISWA